MARRVPRWVRSLLALMLLGLAVVPAGQAGPSELKSLGRFDGWRDNALVGYGLVVGLAGTGDTRQSAVTCQALGNVYGRLGLRIPDEDIVSRNVAVVMVAATLPPSANPGDRISVTVSSAGDARSLAGGTLLLTPLTGPDEEIYALAQGALITGGYSFEASGNQQQRNFPTTARLEQGATIERAVDASLVLSDGELRFLLSEPSFTTASRVAAEVNRALGPDAAWAKGAGEVRIRYTAGARQLAAFVANVESLRITPDRLPRIVINERTGTVVAGADVTISSVVISQGDLRLSVRTENYASQPAFIARSGDGIASLVVSNTEMQIEQGDNGVVAEFPSSTVADLIRGLKDLGVDTNGQISVLQAMKSAGALHADIIVQ